MSERKVPNVPKRESEIDSDYERRCYVELAKLGARIGKLREWNPTMNQLSQLASGMKNLAERHNSRARRLNLGDVQARDHLFSVFADTRAKLDNAFRFLKEGLPRNEAVMMITDEMTKNEMLDQMSRDWHVNARELERRGDVTVKSVREWYFPDGILRIDRIASNWIAITNLAASRGKSGLRVFGDLSSFFKNGFSRELVEYESALDVKFIGIPLTALCGYTDEDIEKLSISQMERLQQHHKAI